MWARKAKRLRSFDAYDQAVDRAALALLAALRDHANPQFSSVQLEALRLRGVGEGAQGHGRKDLRRQFLRLRSQAFDVPRKTSHISAACATLHSATVRLRPETFGPMIRGRIVGRYKQRT